MGILELIFRVFITILVILGMARLSGPKQISQMSFYDYVSGITVGSLAASTSTNKSLSLLNGLLAIVIFLSASIFMGWLSEKSIALRRILTGKPIVLIERGKILWKGLRKARMNMNELLSNLRYSGYFNIDDVDYAMLEPTGKFSVQPKSSARPPKTSELSLSVPAPARLADVIIDGEILPESLKSSGKDEEWLTGALKKQGVNHIKEVGFATLNVKNATLSVYKKEADNQT